MGKKAMSGTMIGIICAVLLLLLIAWAMQSKWIPNLFASLSNFFRM